MELSYEELKAAYDKNKQRQQKRLNTIKEKYGDSYFSDIAKLSHKGGFNDPEVRRKAEEARRNAKIPSES